MNEHADPAERLLAELREQAKDLDCLYVIEEYLNCSDLSLDDQLQRVVEAIPPGWQYPEACRAELEYQGRVFRTAEFQPTPWRLTAEIAVQDEVIGTIRVYYLEDFPGETEGPFLPEEVHLLRTIAARLEHYIFYQHLKSLREHWDRAEEPGRSQRRDAWRAPIQLLRESDRELYGRIARRMLNHLLQRGLENTRTWFQDALSSSAYLAPAEGSENVPGKKQELDVAWLTSAAPFEHAAQYLGDEELLVLVQRWMQEDRASVHIEVLNSACASLPEVHEALRRFHKLVADESHLPQYAARGLRVALIRRVLTEQLDFVNVAKEFISTEVIEKVLDRTIMTGDSQGKLGGKSAGLILAHEILKKVGGETFRSERVKIPETWFLVSSAMQSFVAYNDLEEVHEQKYKSIEQIRHDYPNIVQLFKNSSFPPEVVQGLSATLDEFPDVPLVIRSSSLLEDRSGAAFSGKYKSLFLANQGSKSRRLEALLDAIAEIYASVFGPDPIAYRQEHGLLDLNEEMGILIQAVVGKRIGRYFFPSFAGVAFSNNEFRWSPRIRREDGLIRLVPGMGTRAVDRVSDDYPILVVPGQPDLKVNATIEGTVRYSPKYIDVIDLESDSLVTEPLSVFLKKIGTEYPGFEEVFSVLEGDLLSRAVPPLVDQEVDSLVPDFDRLIGGTDFVERIGQVLSLLHEHLHTPVDIEFAHDGSDFHILQCRAQSHAMDSAPAPIPKDLPEERVLFNAKRYVSNGWIPDLTHLVYVDPMEYGRLRERKDLLDVGKMVGELNDLLPRRRFALIGPGRWGSRGDIKLGVSVTYADINNTAVLIEEAFEREGHAPNLSFGTHFFQDLVESSIRYLPLYPADEGIVFNERFFKQSPNLVPELLPKYRHLREVVRVIDVSAVENGRVVRILMNGELDEAVAILASPQEEVADLGPAVPPGESCPESYWPWRLQMAEEVAARLDPERFGVVALYLFGSTKNATAGPGSDIDLLIHFRGSPEQRQGLEQWLEGWSLCLNHMNYLKTGYDAGKLLDVHIVTDEDIERRSSFAAKIGAVTDAARELPLGKSI